MNKEERKILATLTLHFSQMSCHLFNFHEMAQSPDPNIEQLEASVFYTMEERNKMVDCFRKLKPQITQGIRERRQRKIVGRK